MIAKRTINKRPRGGRRTPFVPKDAPAIDPRLIYTASAFASITGIGEDGILAAEKRGLVIHRVAGRTFISGAAFANYLDTQARSAGASPSGISSGEQN